MEKRKEGFFTRHWYVLPFFLGWLGAIVGYIVAKDENKSNAKKALIFGSVWGIVLMIFVIFLAPILMIAMFGILLGEALEEVSVPEETHIIGLREPIAIENFSINFNAIWFTDKYEYLEADPGYKLAVIKATFRNTGYKETELSLYDELLVDRGYIYEPVYGGFYVSLRPEEIESKVIVFEILEDTEPAELRLHRFLEKEPVIVVKF